MPFWAKCIECGHIVFALTRRLLNDFMKTHDLKSHKRYDDEFYNWKIYTITHKRFQEICIASKNPAFWNALRNIRKIRP